MRISIDERLRPFCHLPGTSLILPGSGYQVQIFPCMIRIYNLQNAFPILLAELTLELKGPIQQFTVCNDLEKGRVVVFGKTVDGWMRYHLMSSQKLGAIRLFIDRAPTGGFPICRGSEHYHLREKEWLDVLGNDSSFEPYQVPACDRLSLGCHKMQDWELIKRRANLNEVFPILHRLGQLVPSFPMPKCHEGTLSLLEACRQNLFAGKPEDAQMHWLNFINGAFSSLLVPQLEDVAFQGLIANHSLHSLEVSPLVLLTEGAHLIRQLFFVQEQRLLFILPHLLPCFPCGRLLDAPLEDGGCISFEWTKKVIRRLILYVVQDQELTFNFRFVRSYRLRQSNKDKGERKDCHAPLFLKKNCHYFFDNFK